MKTVILKLGGSQINPGEIDINFLKKFKELVVNHLDKFRFVIITGGGIPCRVYNEAAGKLGAVSHYDLDMMGIKFTQANGVLVRSIFGNLAYKDAVFDYDNPVEFDKILVATGWKPGHSSNYDAVIWAKNYDADYIINITNVPYIYDKHPKFHDDYKPLKVVKVKDYLKIIGEKWTPGMNSPFDPEATKALPKKTKVIVLTGLENAKAVLDEKEFEGSILEW